MLAVTTCCAVRRVRGVRVRRRACDPRIDLRDERIHFRDRTLDVATDFGAGIGGHTSGVLRLLAAVDARD